MKYTGENLKELLFPLGGIGSGCISIAGNGILCDFEIFNRPNKGSLNGHTHFAVKLTDSSGKSTVRIISGDIIKDLTGKYSLSQFGGYGYGPSSGTMCGFPHFREVEMTAEFPFAVLTFKDPDFPGEIKLTAWSPFIPLDDKNSSIPGAFFEAEYIGDDDYSVEFCFTVHAPANGMVNRKFFENGYAGVHMKSSLAEDSVDYCDMTVICAGEDSFVQESWFRGDWCDAVVTYWNQLTGDGLTERCYDAPGKDAATVVKKCASGDEKKARFVLTWNVPNCYNYWSPVTDENGKHKSWKNYYATLFADSKASAVYSMENYDKLYTDSKLFADSMYSQTLPEYVIEASSCTASVLKTATVLRLENGEFYGWEGQHEKAGSCEGTCQHVWNYAYAMCFLFPRLERSIRDLEFDYTMTDEGRMDFRIKLPLGRRQEKPLFCLDGQMGAVIKTYREWKISGDDEWLKAKFPFVKKALEFAWSKDNPHRWDPEKTGLASGRMHHTLDRELFGPSGWLEGFYLAALKAAAEMAEYLGERDKSREYYELFEKGYELTKKELFNGSYFIQKIDLSDKSIPESFGCTSMYWNDETGEIKYQIGEGCEIDQLCGQWHANILGLGRLFDEKQTKTAAESLFKNNFKESMRDFVNPWRIFALNDDAGSVICDYPKDAYKPKIPIPYCEESMNGFEYQLAGLLISEGFIEEGLKVAKAVRDKYNGSNRNPYNEIECGSNYARSMASFALIPLLSGFIFDMPHKTIGFNPKINKDKFCSLWSLDSGWGMFKNAPEKAEVTLNAGVLTLEHIMLPYVEKVSKVVIDGKAVEFAFDGKGKITFENVTVTKKVEVFM